MSELIQLSKIRRDGGTQSRLSMDETVIGEYAESLREGAVFPPVTLYFDGESYWLADGFHRFAAHLKAGKSEINANIQQGTRRDAVLASVGANANHGLRRSQEDKRNAIMTLLNDKEWGKWSDREIANKVGVSPSTVGKYRASVQTGQIERTVIRGGKSYTMNTENIGANDQSLISIYKADRKKFQGDKDDNYLLAYVSYAEGDKQNYIFIAQDATRAYIRSGARITHRTLDIEGDKFQIAKCDEGWKSSLESFDCHFVNLWDSALLEIIKEPVDSIKAQECKHYTIPEKPAPTIELNTPQDPSSLEKVSQQEGAKLFYLQPQALAEVEHDYTWQSAYSALATRHTLKDNSILLVKMSSRGFVASGIYGHRIETALQGIEHDGKRVGHYYLINQSIYAEMFKATGKKILYFTWIGDDGYEFWREQWAKEATEPKHITSNAEDNEQAAAIIVESTPEEKTGFAEGDAVTTRTGRVGIIESIQGRLVHVKTSAGTSEHYPETLTPAPNEITSPPVRYYGSKWRIAEWVIEQFPPHITYCEPFCGGASILFQKQPAKVEIINDLNGEVVNFFDMLRNRPDELIRAIELTPYSREEHRRAHELDDISDPLERARRFYVRSRQSYASGEGTYSSGWRYQANDKRGTTNVEEWSSVNHLWAAVSRLKSVQIECDDALKTINRFDGENTLFYVDPPYLHETRGSSDDYRHELTKAQHVELAETLHQVQGMVILSGYSSELYNELYSDWRCISKDARANDNHPTTEYLWINPSADDISRLPLFESAGVNA